MSERARAVTTNWIRGEDHPDWAYKWVHELPKARRRDDLVVVDESASGFGWAEPVTEPLPRRISGHRSTTCFDVESTEMRRACVPALRAAIDADTEVHEARHQHNGYHTDLVFADVDRAGLRERDALTVGRAPLHDPLQRFKTWWHVNERGPVTRSDAINDGLYSDPSKNRKHVEWLLDHGWLGRTAADALEAMVPPRIADLHAVELKLRDWSTALEQAARANRCAGHHRADEDHVTVARMRDNGTMPAFWRDRYGYADFRWVALDAGAIGPALDHAGQFRESGVGLLAVAEGGTVVKHIDAEHAPRERYTRDRAWIESEVWAKLDLDEWLAPTDESTASSDGVQPGLATFADGGDADE